MKSNHISKMFILFLAFFQFDLAMADADSDVQYLQQRWAEINYQLESKIQLTAFEQLIVESEGFKEEYPDSAELWIWSGIVKSTYAGTRGGIGALKFAKQAKVDLEQAIEIDGDALSGSAYTSLGTLYFNVPGWPIGFGDDDKAEELLLQSLAINPDGIDNNYFYASFLINEKRYQEAREHLLTAQQAAPRQHRDVADAGRQAEIVIALEEIRGK